MNIIQEGMPNSRLLSRSEEIEEEGYCVLICNFSFQCLDSAYVVDGVTARLRVTASSASNIPIQSDVSIKFLTDG